MKPWNFGFELYLICCLLRHRAGRHLASSVFVVKKEHSDFELVAPFLYNNNNNNNNNGYF